MLELHKFQKSEINKDILKLSSQSKIKREYIKSILTKDFLQELFILHNFTANYISQKILKPKGILLQGFFLIKKAKLYGIKTPNMSESNKNPLRQEQHIETCLKRFGAKNALCRGTLPCEKMKKTIKKKYGTTNVFKLKTVKEKIIQTMLNRYGVRHNIYLCGEKRNQGKRSKPHIKIEEYLLSKDIKFESEVVGRFCKFNDEIQRFYSPSPDILIEKNKIIIEIYGDLWHGNLNFYKSNHIVYGFNLNQSRTVKEIRKFDIIRRRHLKSFGYKIIAFWCSDIKSNFDTIKKIIDINLRPPLV